MKSAHNEQFPDNRDKISFTGYSPSVRGIIKDYSVDRVGVSKIKVTLTILPEYKPEPVHLTLTGKPFDLCKILNGIPFKGNIQLFHLKDAQCLLASKGSEFSFLKLGW